MIFGIGIDIIEVSRVDKKIGKPDFLKKVFSAGEIAYCESHFNKAEHFAARFAAKEAFLKALGTGWQGTISFFEIEILPNKLGKPELTCKGKLKEILEDLEITRQHVSLSHIKEMAAATVVLEK